MSKSGVQLEVLRLFRGFIRELRNKTPETKSQFRELIYARFYQDAKIPKSNFQAIEYQLDLGRRRLQQFKKGQLASAGFKYVPSKNPSNNTGYGPPS
jgi:uncharacterized protein with gpF-like domain